MISNASITDLSPDQLRGRRFGFIELPDRYGRCTIWEHPLNEHIYVAGADMAYGIQGRDFDAAVILNASVTPARQVGELHGHWGEKFDGVLYAALRYWNDAFLLGERQVGLPTLRRLYDDFGFRNLFYDKRDENATKPVTDKLGYARTQTDDVVMRNLRRAVIDRSVEFQSPTLVDQMGRCQWHNQTEITNGERGPDSKLRIKLLGGGSPDLVMAAAYAWHAVGEVERFRFIVKEEAPVESMAWRRARRDALRRDRNGEDY